MSRMADLHAELSAIRERDPECKPDTPTFADIANFKTWAITTYGTEVWEHYLAWMNGEL